MTIDGLASCLHGIHRLLLPACLALASGCSVTAPAPEQSGGIHRGHLSLGPGGELFLPCGGDEALQVRATPALSEHLQAQYLSLVGEPYEEAFIRLRGSRSPAPECAGCTPQAGTLQVEQILDFQAAAPGDCH